MQSQSKQNRIMKPGFMSSINHFSWFPHLVFLILLPLLSLFSLEIPLEFHGRGFLGKYLNSDTIRYNMDASIDIYFTILRYKDFSFFINYRDDLDLAEQPESGVSLDPRYAHYYITGGIDYVMTHFLFSGSFIHDCIHDIDYDVEGTPVFNRFRLLFADADIHPSKRLSTSKKFLWSIELGYYPHWYYHGWIINDGADYNYEVRLKTIFNIMRKESFGINVKPTFYVIRGDTSFYHQHLLQFNVFYRNHNRQIGLGLDYNIWNNDPLKNPDKLWLLSIFIEF